MADCATLNSRLTTPPTARACLRRTQASWEHGRHTLKGYLLESLLIREARRDDSKTTSQKSSAGSADWDGAPASL